MKQADMMTTVAGRLLEDANKLARDAESVRSEFQKLAAPVLEAFKTDPMLVAQITLANHGATLTATSMKDLAAQLQQLVSKWQAAQRGTGGSA